MLTWSQQMQSRLPRLEPSRELGERRRLAGALGAEEG